jgi:probable F420-dependent oxidoreductase
MKIDATLIGPLANVAEVAAAARDAGYDGLFSAEVNHDPFLPLARAADWAGDMELGTSIAVAFARTPMALAYEAWDLQALSGRFILGLGSQVKSHIEGRFSMPWSRPAARMREFVLATRAIWDTWQNGTKLDFNGEFYTHRLMTPMFEPDPIPAGPPRIFVAGVGEKMIRNVAEVADGLFVHGFTTRRYIHEVILPVVESGLAATGRNRSDFEVKYGPFVVTGTTEGEMEIAATETRNRIAFYASTAAYRPVLELHGWGELQTELNVLVRKGQWDAMGELINDEILEEFAVVAPFDELPGVYRRWISGLADRTNIAIPPGVSHEQAASFISQIR